MKKTMFITSVIMVVVMAIALTTSSLAWFSAVGAGAVTTSAFTVSAKSTASTGLQISLSNDSAWGDSVDLNQGNAQTLMIPAVPYQATANDTILAALSHEGNNGVADPNFISNKIDNNGYFKGTAITEHVTSGAEEGYLFFVKDVYIASMDSADYLQVAPSIAWKNAQGSAYTYNTADPIIYVAVLADKNVDVNADRSTATPNVNDWEILTVFTSQGASAGANGTGTFVNFGVEGSAFADEALASSAINGVRIVTSGDNTGISTANFKTTTDLAPITVGANGTPLAGQTLGYGEVKQFRIITWYDGASLKNANSDFSAKFELTFTSSTSTIQH